MNKILGAAVGAIAGPIGAAIGGVLGLIGDPVGTILGFEKQGPCNGLVFSDTIEFSGTGLESQAFQPSTIQDGFFVTLPNAGEVFFTRSYTDEATHNKDTCGDTASVEITFSVLRVPFVSVKNTILRFFNTNLIDGLRRLAPPETAISMRSFLRLRP